MFHLTTCIGFHHLICPNPSRSFSPRVVQRIHVCMLFMWSNACVVVHVSNSGIWSKQKGSFSTRKVLKKNRRHLHYCVCSWHTHRHTRRRKWGVHLQLQDKRERGERRGKRQEYRREHVLRMRAQKPNKSGHEYECNHTIEYTTKTTRPNRPWLATTDYERLRSAF